MFAEVLFLALFAAVGSCLGVFLALVTIFELSRSNVEGGLATIEAAGNISILAVDLEELYLSSRKVLGWPST